MKKRNSIKKKLFQIIMVSTLACVLVSVVISLVAVYSVEQQQIQSSMRFGLSQIRSSIDQEYLGLMNVMRGLEAGGDTGSAAENFLEEKDGFALLRISRAERDRSESLSGYFRYRQKGRSGVNRFFFVTELCCTPSLPFTRAAGGIRTPNAREESPRALPKPPSAWLSALFCTPVRRRIRARCALRRRRTV